MPFKNPHKNSHNNHNISANSNNSINPNITNTNPTSNNFSQLLSEPIINLIKQNKLKISANLDNYLKSVYIPNTKPNKITLK